MKKNCSKATEVTYVILFFVLSIVQIINMIVRIVYKIFTYQDIILLFVFLALLIFYYQRIKTREQLLFIGEEDNEIEFEANEVNDNYEEYNYKQGKNDEKAEKDFDYEKMEEDEFYK